MRDIVCSFIFLYSVCLALIPEECLPHKMNGKVFFSLLHFWGEKCRIGDISTLNVW